MSDMKERFILIHIENDVPIGWMSADSLKDLDYRLRSVGMEGRADAVRDAAKYGGLIEVMPGLWLLREFIECQSQ